MEIINGVERRRRWRAEDKLRMLAEIDGGASVAEVARRHDISRGLLWQWRDAQRRGKLVAETATFVPLRVVPELVGPAAPTPLAASTDPDGEAEDRIEIVLADGTAVRVAEGISTAALRRVLAALRG